MIGKDCSNSEENENFPLYKNSGLCTDRYSLVINEFSRSYSLHSYSCCKLFFFVENFISLISIIMNKYLAIALCLVAVATTLEAGPTKFTTKYDDVDVEEILKNDRLFNSYFACLMDEGKCTTDGSKLKELLPEAIKSKCEPCSEKQKDGANKVVKFLYEKKPEMWKKLEDKYDPEHIYRTLYKEDAKQLGYNV